MAHLEIPIINLNKRLQKSVETYSESILENAIKGIHVELIIIPANYSITDDLKEDYKTIYLFIKGEGQVVTEDSNYKLIPETIFLPNILENIVITATPNDSLYYLKISSKLTTQDQLDLKEFPTKNTQHVYYAKFSDCQSYTETIKSPNTKSRTILPNKYIPRIAMGTVQSIGPDEVGAHEHPMLEQLFLGLSENNCTVYADDTKVNFPEHSILHIPLGSKHSVSVNKDKVMYYVWMDFFLDKKGEEWLKTHIIDED